MELNFNSTIKEPALDLEADYDVNVKFDIAKLGKALPAIIKFMCQHAADIEQQFGEAMNAAMANTPRKSNSPSFEDMTPEDIEKNFGEL